MDYKLALSNPELYENSRYIANNNLFQLFDSVEKLDKTLQLSSIQFENFKHVVENDLLNTFESFDVLLTYVSKKGRKLQLSI